MKKYKLIFLFVLYAISSKAQTDLKPATWLYYYSEIYWTNTLFPDTNLIRTNHIGAMKISPYPDDSVYFDNRDTACQDCQFFCFDQSGLIRTVYAQNSIERKYSKIKLDWDQIGNNNKALSYYRKPGDYWTFSQQSEWQYEAPGKMISRNDYSVSHGVKKSLMTNCVNRFDSQGKCICTYSNHYNGEKDSICYSYPDSASYIRDTWMFRHHETGENKIISDTVFSRTIFTYSGKNLISQLTLNESGDTTASRNYQYNKQNQLTEIVITDKIFPAESGGIRCVFQYAESGLLKRFTCFTAEKQSSLYFSYRHF